MPQRFLKPGLTTSDHWNGIKWISQSFYVRLLTLVDDYGRYDARPAILRSHAFPLRPEVTERIIVELCEELTKHDLAVFYETDGKTVLQLTRWKETPRSEAKFPEFNSASCKQLFASASKCSPPSSSSSSSTSPPTRTREVVIPEKLKTPAFLDKWERWVAFRKTKGKVKDWHGLFQEQLDWLVKFPLQTAVSILSQSLRNGWQGLFEVKGSKQTPPEKPQMPGTGSL